ncbi:MAG: hypothetical protein SGILL_009402 [Bacillariaceae sp.]
MMSADQGTQSEWKDCTIDVSSLFPEGDFAPVGRVLNLYAALKDLSAEREFFLSRQIFVRSEMEQLFREMQNGGARSHIVSGSPGIGKSLVFFLVAIFQAAKKGERVLYFRCTANDQEAASTFLLEKGSEENLVNVHFTRTIDKMAKDIPAIFREVLGDMSLQGRSANNCMRMIDGVAPSLYNSFGVIYSLCASGGGIRITSEMRAGERHFHADYDSTRSMTNIVMGAWSFNDLKVAVDRCRKDAGRSFCDELFESIYFVTGGRIRDAIDMYDKQQVSTGDADEIVGRVSKESAKLALMRVDERPSSDHVDALRSIFRRYDHPSENQFDAVDILVDSQYLVRKLHEKVDGQELLSSYHSALERGMRRTAGDYFEELMHWCLCQPEAFDSISDSLNTSGSGTEEEGVRMLKKSDCYWMPSTPNFVNIDSAIVRNNDHLFCIQYTIQPTHTYKTRRLRPKLLSNLWTKISETTIIFVAPADVQFTPPVEAATECNVKVIQICCDTLDKVKEGLKAVVAATTA